MALKVTDTFKYLDKQQQEEVLRVSDNNSQFAIGLGESLGFVYRINELSENLSKRINENTFLVTGYNEGLGLLFKYLDKQEQKRDIGKRLINIGDSFAKKPRR